MQSFGKRRFYINQSISSGLAGFEPALPCPLLQQVGVRAKQHFKPALAGLFGLALASFESDEWLKPVSRSRAEAR
jgi:hypothetical protein